MADDEKIAEDDKGQPVIQVPLLAELRAIQRGVTRVEKALESKVDRSDMSRIEARLDEHARALSDLQSWRHDSELEAKADAKREKRLNLSRRAKGAVLAFGLSWAATIATAIGTLLSVHH